MTLLKAVIDFLELVPSWVWTVAALFISLSVFRFFIHSFVGFLGGFDVYEELLNPPDIPPPDFPLKWQVKVADILCRWRWGFELMYCLGWAVEGRHFTCPGLDPDKDPD